MGVRTMQDALEQSVPVTAVVLRSHEIHDSDKYPLALRRMEVTPTALSKVQKHIASLNEQPDADSDAFFVADLNAVAARVATWKALMPNVEPLYAVKCNPDPQILALLARLGCGFDCASRLEIQDVLRAGARADQIIYGNTTKQTSHIAFAAAHDVQLMTFDSIDELDKIHRVAPHAQAVLRLLVNEATPLRPTKFGAPERDVDALFAHAQSLNVAVVGVSFHVGSSGFETTAYADAVESAARVFALGTARGFHLTVLDVGGGFPSVDGDPVWFAECAKALTTALAQSFPFASERIRVVAEPGRFFVATSLTLAVHVLARRATVEHGPMYVVNDGIYGAFSGLVFDHPTLQPVVLLSDDDDNDDAAVKLERASVWGQTCDGADCILSTVQLPPLAIGAWLLFPGMGAYSYVAASHFNGFAPPRVVAYIEVDETA